ncbi:EAL domain-containing protein [Nocardioides perillae]|uniref:EAL domain-containing protein (Putative c-di-GMP-specific phosphodiesterase class I) n=1 Tax=Nocardioides perillae TaxID=1119534 RepID=A0A7Y9UJZ6_9ACTN|nr:EAL domain-containing protein [Nocardioides perillae]NYG54793.1 EAL domain-containing protein (putative c-di-GMP-specific phosphodiesterase class I) [Nocardioides perillae]
MSGSERAPAQFGLAFQPLRDLATGRVVAAEALLRWVHPRLGPQPALPTVEMAERSGLMPALGRVVLDGALAAARSWPGDVVVHANVSAHELREPGYVDGVHALLARHRVAPGRLLLELTESALATGPDSVVPVLEDLVATGVRLGLDDFGTGWSSIAQLRASPVDTVKVDRSLTAGIGSSPEEFELVRAVLALVEAAGREVVAEGVEDAVQLAHLRALGCRVGQGHHLGRPQPARALIVD